LTKQELTDLLTSKVITIKFTKKNGDIRTMQCTLKSEYITPTVSNKPSKISSTSNDDRVTVWDIKKSSFRSFYIDSILEVDDSGFFEIDTSI
jgi:hypothetical protein